MVITAAVEGPSDEALLRKLINFLGAELGAVHGRNGKGEILRNLSGYNYAARFRPWIVLVDLDKGDRCPVTEKQKWLADPAPLMCLRIAVRELEAWLLADRERFASFFGVSLTLITENPDALDDPKQEVINIARRSRRKAVREDIVPSTALGQMIGPAYTSRIIEYIGSDDGWRLDVAAESSPSLRRAIAAIKKLIEISPAG